MTNTNVPDISDDMVQKAAKAARSAMRTASLYTAISMVMFRLNSDAGCAPRRTLAAFTEARDAQIAAPDYSPAGFDERTKLSHAFSEAVVGAVEDAARLTRMRPLSRDEREWALTVMITELGFAPDVALSWIAAEQDRRAGRGPAGLKG